MKENKSVIKVDKIIQQGDVGDDQQEHSDCREKLTVMLSKTWLLRKILNSDGLLLKAEISQEVKQTTSKEQGKQGKIFKSLKEMNK